MEDGSTAYIQHTLHMPQSNTILAIQADGTIADLQAEATAIDPETISVLEQYTTKVTLIRQVCGQSTQRRVGFSLFVLESYIDALLHYEK